MSVGTTVGSAIAVATAVGGSVGGAVGSSASTVVAWSACAGAVDGDGVHPSNMPSMATTASVTIAIEFGENT